MKGDFLTITSKKVSFQKKYMENQNFTLFNFLFWIRQPLKNEQDWLPHQRCPSPNCKKLGSISLSKKIQVF
ncbi:hypothetical protein AQUCO_00900334v1 [Aquilegia coerulea]|uniref:Uncharacterized protein n=1 Tax=Aquilegia coerulea TaxID=218851 RepID=A0A2G5EDN5_AQUCA|nr:hypothetical protein AQUCO_00900334v1 [Aquilegia coerulea]